MSRAGAVTVANGVEGPLVVDEEAVDLDLGDAAAAEALRAVRQEGADETLGRRRDLNVVGKVQRVFVVHDLAVGAHQRFGVEGRVAHQHLVQEHAHRPPVALTPIQTWATKILA